MTFLATKHFPAAYQLGVSVVPATGVPAFQAEDSYIEELDKLPSPSDLARVWSFYQFPGPTWEDEMGFRPMFNIYRPARAQVRFKTLPVLHSCYSICSCMLP